MTRETRLSLSPAVAAAAILSVLLTGAGVTYLIMRPGSPPAVLSGGTSAVPPERTRAGTPGRETPPGAAPPTAVAITLTKEGIERAGLELTNAAMTAGADRIRLPGVVEPNAYRQVAVTSLVGGRVVSVPVQLGDRVRRGQTLAQIYSPELADARTKYVAAKSMLEAHDRELQRTQRLVEIGAASRQELERIHAEHAAQIADLESARARLQLLGVTADNPGSQAENATVEVAAPIDGVVTERVANAGLNVDLALKLFLIIDLSNVWIVADVYEKDLGRVRLGAPATVTTAAYPDLSLGGRVSYIDPQLNATTRTAKARIEVANPRGELRLGMYTDVAIETGQTTSGVAVPRGAIQTVGNRQVVYVTVPGEPTRFVEREVRLGNASGEIVEVSSGLSANDTVVSKGSFFIRAELERLGLRPAAEVQTARIDVTEKGFEPDHVPLRAGVPARLTVVRMTDKTCGTQIVFPRLNITRELPLNEPVVIQFTPAKTGDIAFACGMNMLKGVTVVGD